MSKKIMVIYGHEDLSNLLEMILTDQGYQAQIYSDRRQACAALLEGEPDLLIIEPSFGKLQIDRQFIRNLRSTPFSANLPVIVCTVDTTTLAEQNHFFGSVLENIEVQPFEADQLLDAIKNMLERAKK